jgi:hypothetical protein
MANSYKDIIITSNKSSGTADPKIEFRGANSSVNTAITVQAYPTSSGTLSFEGTAGQLFSVTNDLTGSIFSVNDVSGIPSIEVFANGQINLAQYGGRVAIGIAQADAILHPAMQAGLRGVFVSATTNDITNRYYSGYNSVSGGDTFRVYTNGNIVNTNGSYGSISDIKLKENILDAAPKLDKLLQIRIVNYNLKNLPDQKLIGVVAQELEQVFPGMVDETSDHDADGNDLGTTTKSVKYSVFVPMLIKAMQEQQALITSLTDRVAQLEGN